MKIARTPYFLCLIFAGFPVFAQVNASSCGPLANNFGPYDFRPEKFVQNDLDSTTTKRLVEGAHFTPRVEQLIGSQSKSMSQSEPPGGDIDYTLRAFPNHHRALMSVMKYGERKKSDKPYGLHHTVECYFERALRFSPDDTIARMLYATFLTRKNRLSEAASQLEVTAGLAAENPFTHYNIGLVYFDMKNYGKALAQAHRATALGFERTELRDLLKGVNKWQEPPAEPTVEPKAQQ